jgi:hypothetical protein
MKWKTIITVGFILLFSVYCTAKEHQVSQNVTDNHPSYKEFVSSHTFPYQAPPERQNQLRKNYPRLTLEMTKAQVEEVLGVPDFASKIYSKSKEPGFLGWNWTYFFEKPDPKLTNLKLDKSIEVSFKTNGKTNWIKSNVEGLSDIGSPSQ